jgi:excisionase family DNA binding protein
MVSDYLISMEIVLMQSKEKTRVTSRPPSREALDEALRAKLADAIRAVEGKPDVAAPFEPLAYGVNDFCRRIGVSPSTFWKLVAEEKIHVTRIGGRTLIPASEVARLLREGTK